MSRGGQRLRSAFDLCVGAPLAASQEGTRPQIRRLRRSRERGLTLIEMILTIAIISVGIVGIAASFSTAELAARDVSVQSQLEAQARLDTDLLRSDCLAAITTTQCGSQGVPYIICAGTAAATGGSYSSYIPDTVTVTLETSATSNSAGTLANPAGKIPKDCGGSPDVQDYGIQKLTVTVTATGRSLSRIVYKKWNALAS
jgi:prepilin-type N-terminal cleavage/methylation domain-containing protein